MEYIDPIGELVQKSATGNAGSFRALYEHLIDKVHTYVRYRTNSEDDALDLAQEIFVDLYKALPAFRYASREQFYGFVFTITKRKLAKHYADKHTQATKVTQVFDETHHSEKDGDPILADEVSRALQRLDGKTREIVVLHHWSRYTFGEIATLIDMTESAVRVKHHRGLKTLSAYIDS